MDNKKKGEYVDNLLNQIRTAQARMSDIMNDQSLSDYHKKENTYPYLMEIRAYEYSISMFIDAFHPESAKF